jgi:2-phospho-L-lactate guanylyltransferase
VLVPIKGLVTAKTRLAADSKVRRQLALAMALDTLAALRAAELVASLWVVTGDSRVRTAVSMLGTVLIEEPTTDEGDPLNAALRCGLQQISAVTSDGPVAIVASDLPALRSGELDRVLEIAGKHERAVVADRTGSGTQPPSTRRQHSARTWIPLKTWSLHFDLE